MNVVITGYGVVTPYGLGVETMMQGIDSNTIPFIDKEINIHKYVKLPSGIVPPINENLYNEISYNISRIITNASIYAYLAYKEAKQMAMLSDIDASKAAIFIGSTLPSINNNKLATDIFKSFINNPAFILAEIIGSTNRVIAPCSACSTGLQAINLATEAIKSGQIDIAICGATEEWSEELANIFIKLGIVSKTGCRPFANDRDGIIISEGAGILILESEEHAKNRLASYNRVIAGTGYSFSTNPSAPTKESIMKCMLDSYSYFHQTKNEGEKNEVAICAHATGTYMGDKTELEAINDFKKLIYKNSKTRLDIIYYKQLLGHTMAASGVIELIASLREYIPVLNNAFGLGGVNCSTLVVPYQYL